MANVQTQIRIDKEVKQDATALFKSLGLDMSSAVNIFLRQCLIHGGLPFQVEVPKYNKKTQRAIEEAMLLAKDSETEYYTDMESLKKSLLD